MAPLVSTSARSCPPLRRAVGICFECVPALVLVLCRSSMGLVRRPRPFPVSVQRRPPCCRIAPLVVVVVSWCVRVCVCVCVCGIFSLPFLSIYYYRTSVSGHFPLASSLFSGSSLFFFVFDESAPAPTGHPPPVFFCSATRGPTGAPAPNKSRTRGETTGDSTEFRFLRSHSLLLHYNDDTHYHHRSAVSTRRRKQVESLFFSSSLVHKGIADCGDRFEDSLLAHCLTVCHRSESTVG